MENKNYTIEGLTFERIRGLLELEFNYKKLKDDLVQKEKYLKEKYKIGTIEFIDGADEPYSPRFRKIILDKNSGIKELGKNLEREKNINDKTKERVEFLENKLEKITEGIQNINRYL